jgi:type IV pilus assembly protein PilC
MATFVFRVGTPQGDIVDRKVEASSLAAAREEIERQGLHVFQVRRRSLRPSLRTGRRVISTERFLLFNQELLALVRAGLPIVQSLDLMLERQENPHFREILRGVRDKVRSGMALSDAFASFGEMFPPIYSNSLRAGERSGDLEGVIRRFLRYQKLIVALRKKVVGTLVYPAVLVALSVVMIYVMLAFVIPKFSEFYAGFDAELPVMTRYLIDFAFFMRQNTVLTIIGLVGLIFGVHRWSRTRGGRQILDRIKLRIPIAGSVIHSFAIMQFTQSLGTLLAGGTPMVPALETASQSVTNTHVSSRIRGIVQRVREGEPLWHSLESTGVMTNIAIEMIKVGESTGALVEMLNNVGEFYDEEIETRLNRMMALLEPLILVALGVVIAALLYAFYLPLFEITKVQNV